MNTTYCMAYKLYNIFPVWWLSVLCEDCLFSWLVHQLWRWTDWNNCWVLVVVCRHELDQNPVRPLPAQKWPQKQSQMFIAKLLCWRVGRGEYIRLDPLTAALLHTQCHTMVLLQNDCFWKVTVSALLLNLPCLCMRHSLSWLDPWPQLCFTNPWVKKLVVFKYSKIRLFAEGC